MSGANAHRTLPPGDRDDAPELPIEAGRYGHLINPEIGPHDDAPPLNDETDEARLAKLTRFHADATRHMGEALRLLAAGKHQGYAAALHAFDKSTTEAAALSRVLSRSHTARR